jgi:RNA polymerase sigma-70 factor (ECF subfamily)
MDLFNLTDEELITLFNSGNEHSFSILAMRYKKKIFESILMIIKDRCQAEDILQDAYIKIIKSLKEGRYKHEDKFAPWAIRIARNLCMDFIRKQKHCIIKPVLQYQDSHSQFRYYEESHELKVMSNQASAFVHDLLNYLPEEQREVIIFRHFKDMSFKEIALLTNCSINTAIGRMRYGLLNLRKLTMQRQVA